MARYAGVKFSDNDFSFFSQLSFFISAIGVSLEVIEKSIFLPSVGKKPALTFLPLEIAFIVSEFATDDSRDKAISSLVAGVFSRRV